MKNLKVSLDPISYQSKPKGYEGAISNRISSNVVCVDNIKLFAEDVGKKGRTFCPATFKSGVRSKENFEQAQLLVLDFDNGITWQQVKERSDQYELPVLFAYETFSSTATQQRFRAVFMNDASVTEARVVEVMQSALQNIFPESDSNCQEVSHMFFGGNSGQLLHFDESIPTVNIDDLLRNMCLCLHDKYGVTHYKRKIEEFSQRTGLALNDRKMPDVTVTDGVTGNARGGNNGNFSPSGISNIIVENGENLPNKVYQLNFSTFSTSPSSGQKPKSNPRNPHRTYRSDVLKNISSKCSLFREFKTGSRILHHQELFGIATNIIQIESGETFFTDTLMANAYFDDRVKKYDDWNYTLHYIRDYTPASCNNYCPYCNQCNHGSNIISTAIIIKRRTINKIADYNETYVSLEEAEEDFRLKLQEAINSKDSIWYIIKAQTALGKTRTYLELMKNTTMKILIAVPTVILKNEIYADAKKMGIDKIVEAPSLEEIKDELPDYMYDHIDYLYKSGKYHAVYPYIKKIVENNEEDTDFSKILSKYMNDMKKFKDFNGHAIITHRRLLYLSETILKKYDAVIIDEDILYKSIVPDKKDISIADLKSLLKTLSQNDALYKKIKKILDMVRKSRDGDNYLTLRAIDYDEDDNEDMPTGIDISSLSRAKKFCYIKKSGNANLLEDDTSTDYVSFYNEVKFKPNIKYIMLSATASEEVCEYYIKDYLKQDMEFYDCKKAQYKGQLIQNYTYPMSRSYIDRKLVEGTDIFNQIQQQTSVQNIITFKKYQKNDLYFGNLDGSNVLKGKNILVIGTPHQPDWVYKFFAYSIGLDFYLNEEFKYKGVTVRHNGYEFRFPTYEDEVLRTIQIWMIESDLEQAVGRARLLREDCKVRLYSNFPLGQAILDDVDYDNGDN